MASMELFWFYLNNDMKIDLTKPSQIFFFIVILPLLSYLLITITNFILQSLNGFWFYSLIDTFGILGIYAILYSFFNNLAWKYSVFSVFGIVNFPNLNGRWKGIFISSYDKKETQTILEIKQTFSNTQIFMHCSKSSSKSVMADFEIKSDGLSELHYEYYNEPSIDADATMHGHNGVVKLTYFKENNTLEGSYFNSSQHGRGNTGILKFEFESKILKGKL